MINAIVPILRAAVQALVGAVLAWLAVRGLPVSPDVAVTLTLTLTAVLTGLLARGQHWIERRYPWLGVALLTPTYSGGLNKLRAVNADVVRTAAVEPPRP